MAQTFYYDFHANLFVPPLEIFSGTKLLLRGQTLTPLLAEPNKALTFDQPYQTTWEQVEQALVKNIPTVFFEPDGSFICSGRVAGEFWLMNGHLYDFSDHLMRFELHGSCPAETFELLLKSIGWPTEKIVFELVLEGVTLTFEDFQRFATTQPTPPS